VIVTECEQFRALDLDRLKQIMACPVLILVLSPTRCLAFAALMRDDVLGCALKDTRKANYPSFLLQPFFSLPRRIC
jgi:hypothetical protein